MQPDRIKMARNRFLNIHASFPKSAVYGAFTYTVSIETGKNTLFTIDDGGDQFSVGIGIGNPLPVDHPPVLWSKDLSEFQAGSR